MQKNTKKNNDNRHNKNNNSRKKQPPALPFPCSPQSAQRKLRELASMPTSTVQSTAHAHAYT